MGRTRVTSATIPGQASAALRAAGGLGARAGPGRVPDRRARLAERGAARGRRRDPLGGPRQPDRPRGRGLPAEQVGLDRARGLRGASVAAEARLRLLEPLQDRLDRRGARPVAEPHGRDLELDARMRATCASRCRRRGGRGAVEESPRRRRPRRRARAAAARRPWRPARGCRSRRPGARAAGSRAPPGRAAPGRGPPAAASAIALERLGRRAPDERARERPGRLGAAAAEELRHGLGAEPPLAVGERGVEQRQRVAQAPSAARTRRRRASGSTASGATCSSARIRRSASPISAPRSAGSRSAGSARGSSPAAGAARWWPGRRRRGPAAPPGS